MTVDDLQEGTKISSFRCSECGLPMTECIMTKSGHFNLYYCCSCVRFVVVENGEEVYSA